MSGAENQQQSMEEDKKPGVGESNPIMLKVIGWDGKEAFFKMRRTTKLNNLMHAYADQQSLELEAIRFFFYGRLVRKEQTPDELEMKDGDEIDIVPSIGGPCLSCMAAFAAQSGYLSSTPSVPE